MIEAIRDTREDAREPGAAPTALLVEDEPLVAMLTEETLRDLGFEPIWAESAGAALDMLKREPGLVLAVIDVGLPDMRGDDLARTIRREHPRLGIIVASGHDEIRLRTQFDGDPRTVVLGKPYRTGDLANCAGAVTAG